MRIQQIILAGLFFIADLKGNYFIKKNNGSINFNQNSLIRLYNNHGGGNEKEIERNPQTNYILSAYLGDIIKERLGD